MLEWFREWRRRRAAMRSLKKNLLWMRSRGTLVGRDGVIIYAYPVTEDRIEIELAPSIMVGAIVRDPKTGCWQYDDAMRQGLGMTENPTFATEAEAGKNIVKFCAPLPQINDLVRLGSHKGSA